MNSAQMVTTSHRHTHSLSRDDSRANASSLLICGITRRYALTAGLSFLNAVHI